MKKTGVLKTKKEESNAESGFSRQKLLMERFEDGEVLITSVESQKSEFFLNSVANREGNRFSLKRIISLQTEIGRLALIVGTEA